MPETFQEDSASIPTPEWYHQKIDMLSPQKSGYQDERKALYRELQDSDISQTAKVFILATIYTSLCHQLQVEKAIDSNPAWYVVERKRLTNGPLEKGWDDIPDHPLVWQVQWWPPNRGRIIFYPLPMVRCPHGRYTKTCTVIRGTVERLRRHRQPSAAGVTIAQATAGEPPGGVPAAELKAVAAALTRGRQQKLSRELKKQGVDPGSAVPDNFCAYREPTDRDLEEDRKWWALLTDQQPRPAHRPRSHGLAYAIVSDLTRAGWGVAASCRFAANVLLYCFDISDDTNTEENLRQQWYRSHKNSKPQKPHVGPS
jgi:hypothetical protein